MGGCTRGWGHPPPWGGGTKEPLPSLGPFFPLSPRSLGEGCEGAKWHHQGHCPQVTGELGSRAPAPGSLGGVGRAGLRARLVSTAGQWPGTISGRAPPGGGQGQEPLPTRCLCPGCIWREGGSSPTAVGPLPPGPRGRGDMQMKAEHRAAAGRWQPGSCPPLALPRDKGHPGKSSTCCQAAEHLVTASGTFCLQDGGGQGPGTR